MWWWVRPALLGAVIAGVAGCGFRPMYGSGSATAPAPEMRRIHVGPIAQRVGQQVRLFLMDRLTPQGQPAEPRYRLDVALNSNTEDLGIRRDDTASRARYHLKADFELRSVAEGEVIYEDRVSATSSHNILDNSYYGTLVSERASRKRAARQVSEAIRTRIGLFFKRRGAGETARNEP